MPSAGLPLCAAHSRPERKRLYLLPGMTVPPEFASLVAGAINVRAISDQWFELLRLAMSIKTGTVTASVILRKLAAYPRQNSLALALRELGKLERTFFTLQWLQDPELRRRSHVGLNKGEQQNALRRAVFFNRLGEIRDRSYENQRHRASGLNLLVAAIISMEYDLPATRRRSPTRSKATSRTG